MLLFAYFVALVIVFFRLGLFMMASMWRTFTHLPLPCHLNLLVLILPLIQWLTFYPLLIFRWFSEIRFIVLRPNIFILPWSKSFLIYFWLITFWCFLILNRKIMKPFIRYFSRNLDIVLFVQVFWTSFNNLIRYWRNWFFSLNWMKISFSLIKIYWLSIRIRPN